MSYIVEYTTLSGKKIPMVHKTHEHIEEAIAHASVAVKTGIYKSYKITEGHKVLPAIDRDRYTEIPGLEGPFRTLNGGVVYYDPKEGAYYDKDRDVYLSYDEFRQMDTDYSGMKDERDIPVKEEDVKLDEISPDLAKRYTKNAEIDRDNTDHILQRDGSRNDWETNQKLHKRNSKRAKGIKRAKKAAVNNGDDMVEVFVEPTTMKTEDTVNEISDKTLKSYHQKAIRHGVEVGMGKTVTDKDGNKRYEKPSAEQEKLSNKRITGAAKAMNKVLARKKSGVKEVAEDISQDAHHMERDHEVQMARSDLYKTANYAIKLHAILKGISEEQGLDGWMQAKITKAADYMSSVFHALEYDELERSQSEPIVPIESVDETTSAGGIASVAQPMGKMIKRKKK